LIEGVWIIGCPAAGSLIAMMSGEFGSVLFAILGLYVGILGALASLILWRSRWFRALQYTGKVALCSLVVSIPILALLRFEDTSTAARVFLVGYALRVSALAVGASWMSVAVVHRRAV
jgi:hypothetical protein